MNLLLIHGEVSFFGNANGISPRWGNLRIHYPIHKFPLLVRYEGKSTFSFRASVLRWEVVIPAHPQFGGPPIVEYTGPPIECNLFVATTYTWKQFPWPGIWGRKMSRWKRSQCLSAQTNIYKSVTFLGLSFTLTLAIP